MDDIFRTLEDLNLDYDLGPSGTTDFLDHWSQKERIGLYNELLYKLLLSGEVFACKLSRKAIKSLAADGRYPAEGRTQHLDLEQDGVSWRIKTPDVFQSWTDTDGTPRQINLYDEMRDFVVRRSDGTSAYQVASLADDLHFGVNLIVRGEDLLPSTAAQRFLAGMAGGDTFLSTDFYHHPILSADDGLKLSKSAGAMTSPATWDKQQIARIVAAWVRHFPQKDEMEELLFSHLES